VTLTVSRTDCGNSAALCCLNFGTEKETCVAYVGNPRVLQVHCFLWKTEFWCYTKSTR